MKQFKNEWSRLHDAMKDNIKGKEELLEKLAAGNVEMLGALKLCVLAMETSNDLHAAKTSRRIDPGFISNVAGIISKAERKGE
jgi:hypothetical protein